MLVVMDKETLKMAGLGSRKVDTVDRDGRPAKRAIAGRTYPTSIDDLWDAVTNIERIPRWFLPVTGDLKPGGRYQLEGNAGGEVLACDPPHRFEITWEYGGEVSWVTVRLSGDPSEEEAKLELEHVAHVPDDLWDQFGPGAVGIGWDLGLMGLGLHLIGGETVDPKEVEAWQASEDGLAFIAEASAGWAEASIADGTDPKAARDAGERVTAFYTGSDG